MQIRSESTIDDLYHVTDHRKAELVNGELVYMSPTGFLPGYAAGEIFASLRAYARRAKNGYAIPDNVGFIVDLPHRRSFSPDVAFYTGKLSGMKFLEGAPVFAVEIRSENDYGPQAEHMMEEKRKDYFLAGTWVIWDVNLLSLEVIKVYRKNDPKNPVIYQRGQIAEAEPAVPGWRMPVNDLFL